MGVWEKITPARPDSHTPTPPNSIVSLRLRNVLAQVGSFLLAGGLLYLALRGVDLDAVGEALRTADYRWLAPLIAIALFSHLLRAWRWQVLLEALPALDGRQGAALGTAFSATMIGYMVNYAAPRLGEFARAGILARSEERSFSGVFGTVVVERVLDVVVLGLALLSVFALLWNRLAVLDEIFLAPAREQLVGLPLAVLLAAGAVLAALAFLAYALLARRTDGSFWEERVRPVLTAFAEGLRTLMHTRRPGIILVSTLAMWACYTLMAYLPLHILHLAVPYDLTLLDAWALMVLGALGVLVPAPGGTGSYHYITIQALVYLFGVPETPAASYAVLTHGAQLVLYTLVGLLCLLVQGYSLRGLRRTTRAAVQQADASLG